MTFSNLKEDDLKKNEKLNNVKTIIEAEHGREFST